MKIGVLCSQVRGDEKLIFNAIRERGHTLVRINSQNFGTMLDARSLDLEVDIVLNRSISSTRGLYITKILETRGIKVVNDYEVIERCENKLYTSLLLEQAGVSTPKVRIAYTSQSAYEAVQELGYPVVVKPTTGSWGRLIAKIDTPAAAEAIFEHKTTLGTYHHSVFYIQEYIEKSEDPSQPLEGNRDIRAFVIDGQAIAAIYRSSPHWITNTARGGKATNCPITPQLQDICYHASKTIGGGILAMDVFETDAGYTINEVNHTMEFKNSEEPTGVNISGAIIEYLEKCNI